MNNPDKRHRPMMGVMWFRHDLRTDDNEAAEWLAEHCDEIRALFIFPQRGILPGGKSTAGGAFMVRSLERLRNKLQRLGTDLILRTGDPEKVVPAYLKEIGAQCIAWNRSYDPVSRDRDTRLEKKLEADKITVKHFAGNYLIEPWESCKADGTPYKVFTPFKNACRDKLRYVGICDSVREWAGKVPPEESRNTDSLLKEFRETVSTDQFPLLAELEESGETRLIHFLEKGLKSYDQMRDTPSVRGTSLLSAYLVYGELSVRDIWVRLDEAERDFHPAEKTAAEVFRSELIWREFACHLLYHFPTMAEEPLRAEFRNFPWEDNQEHFDAWKEGRTGYPIVDAGMRQLLETGWMHNRVRMIVGSFLVKDLLLPWQWGEQWFRERLADWDPAQNAMNWQWVAGCGADASPFFRVFNPVLQGEKFDKQGNYVREYVPELNAVAHKFIHKPWQLIQKNDGDFLPINNSNSIYPHPIVDHAKAREEALKRYHKL